MDLSKVLTPNQLVEFYQQQVGIKKEKQPENLRYAIYVRKSTEENTKQVRSIEDQLSECKILAQNNNIVVLKENIIEESGSAKTSGIRPKFRKLLDRIIAGELDGIVAWHPDRLSRNMLEAGEIIDLLDREIIVDLKFASHPFSNDQAGKMLLGILFVMAKQYSEKLSIDSSRGSNKKAEEGKVVGIVKHGYRKNKNDLMEPDGNNFVILHEAFQRKLKGETLGQIAKYMTDSGYFRRGKDNSERKINITTSLLGKIFSDPVYTGVLIYGKKTINLMDRYDFEPMISVEDFMKINKFKSYEQAFKTKKSRRRDTVKKADLLTDRVICDCCGQVTQAGISRSKTNRQYYYFRCNTDGCERRPRSTRAKVVVNFAKEFLKQKPFTSKEAYSSYKKEIIRIQREGLQGLNSQMASVKIRIGIFNDDLATIKKNLAKETDEEIKKEQKSEMKRINKSLLNSRTLYEELISKKSKVTKSPITFNEFTEIMDSITTKLNKVQSTTKLNAIISKVFSNFSIDGKNVVSYTLNEPFDKLISDDFSKCEPSRARTK